MDFADFKSHVRKAHEKEKSVSALTDYPMMRKGQIAWNELYEVRPDICRLIMAGAREIDPFVDDSRLPAFYEFVEENW